MTLLADEIASYLAGSARAQTVSEIARAIHARNQHVRLTLRDDPRFVRTRVLGRSRVAKLYIPRDVGPEARGGGEQRGGVLTRKDLMLATLRDGNWHSRHDIFRAAGRYFLTNNAASELRASGYDVQHRRQGRNDEYRLVTA